MPDLVLDSGALIAIERGDRKARVRVDEALRAEFGLKTNGAVIAEVWRDDQGRQARLAKFLKGVDIENVDEELGRQAGILLGRAGRGHAIDAIVVASAATGDRILTTDPGDIRPLAAASRRAVFVVPC